MSKESNHLHYLTLIHLSCRCIPCLQWYRGKNNKQSDNYRLYHKACARGVHVSSKVTQAAQILAFLTFWVIQFVTLIIRADQHIFGKCCSAESENSLHRREDFNQEAVAKQTAWALLIHSPPYKVGLGPLHRSQGSRLQDWLLKHVNSCTKVARYTQEVKLITVLPGSGNLVFTCINFSCFVA